MQHLSSQHSRMFRVKCSELSRIFVLCGSHHNRQNDMEDRQCHTDDTTDTKRQRVHGVDAKDYKYHQSDLQGRGGEGRGKEK